MINYDVALLNEFNLRKEHLDKLESYYILHWRLDYLLRKLNDDGTLTHGGVTYIPIYCERFTGRPDSQMKLSFRKQHQDEMCIDRPKHYVLIKAA